MWACTPLSAMLAVVKFWRVLVSGQALVCLENILSRTMQAAQSTDRAEVRHRRGTWRLEPGWCR